MEKSYENCRRFDSLTALCPNRDNEYFFEVRNWHQENLGKAHYLSHETIKEVNKDCAVCGSFEPIKRT